GAGAWLAARLVQRAGDIVHRRRSRHRRGVPDRRPRRGDVRRQGGRAWLDGRGAAGAVAPLHGRVTELAAGSAPTAWPRDPRPAGSAARPARAPERMRVLAPLRGGGRPVFRGTARTGPRGDALR